MASATKIFYIEGNIGSGKSTLIRHLRSLAQKRHRLMIGHTPFAETGSFIYQIKKTLYSIYCMYMQNYSYSSYLYQDSDSDDEDDVEFSYSDECSNILGKKIIFLEEPLHEWEKITDPSGKNILQKFYEDQHKYAFAFQVMSLQTRSRQLRHAIEENPDAIIVSERSIFTDRDIFAKMLNDDGKIDPLEMKVYNLVFDETRKILDGTVQKRIYLQSSPENTHTKKCGRNRPGEEGVSLEYLKKCHEYHQGEFSNSDIVINIDDYHVDTPKYSILLRTLMDFIN